MHKEVKKRGRPSTYTPEMADEICDTIACTSKGLRRLCKENPHWPPEKIIMQWRIKNHDFSAQYTRAKTNQIETLVDSLLTISEDSSNDYVEDEEGKLICNRDHIARCRLRVDTIKWLAGKLAPKIYGDKIQERDQVDRQGSLQMTEELTEEYIKDPYHRQNLLKE